MNQQKTLHNLLYALAGWCCMVVAIGIARFAYTPILPLMINHDWLNKLQAGYLGAVNLLGYFGGAILARIFMQRFGAHNIIRYALIFCVLSLFFCGIHFGVYWLYSWRLIAGLTAGLIMISAPTQIFAATAAKLKATISGIMFSGIGAGIILSGVIVPFTQNLSLSFTWYLLGTIALLLMIVAWFTLPKATATDKNIPPHQPLFTIPMTLAIVTLASSYFLYGVGFTPHTLFLVEYITRFLGNPNSIGALSWTLFGIGTVVGTISAGLVADKIGVGKCLVGAYALSIIGLLLILFSHMPISLMLSSFIMGTLFISFVSLSSTQLSKLVPHHQYPSLWGMMTGLFAFSQTASAYGMSHLIQYQGSGYHAMFLIALIAVVLAFIFSFYLLKQDQKA